MHWLDIVLLVWLLVALVMGTRAGFVYAAGRLIGLIVGVWLAGRWTPQLSSAFGTNTVTAVIIFLVLLSLLTKLGGLLAWVADKFFRILTIIPFLKTFNKVFGGVLGLLISIIIISIGVLGVQLFASETVVSETVSESAVASTIGEWSHLYDFLLPAEWTGQEAVSENADDARDAEEESELLENESEEDEPAEEASESADESKEETGAQEDSTTKKESQDESEAKTEEEAESDSAQDAFDSEDIELLEV